WQIRLAKLCTCPHSAEAVLEDTDGSVQFAIRLRPIMALVLVHEMDQKGCRGVTAYHLLHELVRELGGELSGAIIDASQEGTPIGLIIIRREGREIRHPCHPVDAIAVTLRTQVPLYATERALRIGTGEDLKTWLETVKPDDFF
ncbi:MAG: bifunctional nuclease domain-containing protein, partial [Candidatus Methylomirabilales bacterium]